jgi:hypothetical protein
MAVFGHRLEVNDDRDIMQCLPLPLPLRLRPLLLRIAEEVAASAL